MEQDVGDKWGVEYLIGAVVGMRGDGGKFEVGTGAFGVGTGAWGVGTGA